MAVATLFTSKHTMSRLLLSFSWLALINHPWFSAVHPGGHAVVAGNITICDCGYSHITHCKACLFNGPNGEVITLVTSTTTGKRMFVVLADGRDDEDEWAVGRQRGVGLPPINAAGVAAMYPLYRGRFPLPHEFTPHLVMTVWGGWLPPLPNERDRDISGYKWQLHEWWRKGEDNPTGRDQVASEKCTELLCFAFISAVDNSIQWSWKMLVPCGEATSPGTVEIKKAYYALYGHHE